MVLGTIDRQVTLRDAPVLAPSPSYLLARHRHEDYNHRYYDYDQDFFRADVEDRERFLHLFLSPEAINGGGTHQPAKLYRPRVLPRDSRPDKQNSAEWGLSAVRTGQKLASCR